VHLKICPSLNFALVVNTAEQGCSFNMAIIETSIGEARVCLVAAIIVVTFEN